MTRFFMRPAAECRVKLCCGPPNPSGTVSHFPPGQKKSSSDLLLDNQSCLPEVGGHSLCGHDRESSALSERERERTDDNIMP